MFKEFKEFAMRGNVVDLAVGIIIGAAFGKIVSSFVNDVIMPSLGLLIGNVDFSQLHVVLNGESHATLQADIELVGAGVEPHRKAVLIVRQDLTPGSPYADACVHGDGLTGLQYRLSSGGETHQHRANISGACRLSIERRGHRFTILAGLPGAGKSTLAAALASTLRAMHLRIDTIEQAIRDSGVQPVPLDDAGYRVGYALAEDNLRLGHTVIADSVNPWPMTRDAWVSAAKRAGADWREIESIDADDRRWLRGRRAPQGRFNAGQKVNTILTLSFALLFLVSGFMLWLGERDHRFILDGTGTVHEVLTLASVGLLVGHLYLALIHPATRHALRGMTVGDVREDWARAHHSKWVDEEQSVDDRR